MEDNFVDLTVTSPPYDNLRTYTGEAEWNFEVFKEIAKELYRVTKQGGVVVWVVGDATIKGSETGTSFKQALYFKEMGFNLHDTMIWKKTNPIPLTHNRYEQHFEYMFIFSKGSPKTFNPIKIPCVTKGQIRNWKNSNKEEGSAARNRNEVTVTKSEKIKGNVWEMSVSHTKYNHPAIFPEKLAQDHILSWSNEGDIVYDPFMGSGTTAKMAILNNRNYIGSEISKEYCNIAEERLNLIKSNELEKTKLLRGTRQFMDDKVTIVVKGISSSGKSTRVYLFLKFLREMVEFTFHPYIYKNRELGLLCDDLNLLFIGKEYEGNGIIRWQGLDSKTGLFGSNADISNFIRDADCSVIIEGAGTTQSHRFRPKYLYEYCGIRNMIIQYYSFPSDGYGFYRERVFNRTGKYPGDTMWHKNKSYLKEYNKSLLELKEIPSDCRVFIDNGLFDSESWDLGVKILEFLGLGEYSDLYFLYCESSTYVSDNVFKC